MSYRVGSYQACSSCGSTRVVREVAPASDGIRERVIVTCRGCDGRRASYLRKKRK
jgi:hypothetical protein